MSSNPLHVSIPYTFNSAEEYPTEILAERFQAWRSIIKDLVVYLKEFVLVQDEIVHQQKRLQQVVGHQNEITGSLDDPQNFFLPLGNGSIHDLPLILLRFHEQNIANGQKTYREVQSLIIPKLEGLRHDLLLKIKEIKNLHSDFKNNLHKDLLETKNALSNFNQVMSQSAGENVHVISDKLGDPYLAKARLDAVLKAQIKEENYLYQAYQNLQELWEKLEQIVVGEIQQLLGQFVTLITTEALTIPNYLAPNLVKGFLAKDPKFEWDLYILRNLPQLLLISNNISLGKFIDLSYPARKLLEIDVPHHDLVVAMAVREGQLERRLKYLKLYSQGWYVLTCNFIHEFKTRDRRKDPNPAMLLSLDSCTVTEHSKDGPQGPYKFVLLLKLTLGLMHRNHNLVFRCSTYKEMIGWYQDIKLLLMIPLLAARVKWVEKNKERPQPQRQLRLLLVLLGRSVAGQNLVKPRALMDSHRLLVHQRPLSQTTLIANANRLLLTFLQKHNELPRLLNMINLDGTAITPVDTVALDPRKPEVGQRQLMPMQPLMSHALTIPLNGPMMGQTYYDQSQGQYYTITPVAMPQAQPVAVHAVQPNVLSTSPQQMGPVSPQLMAMGRPGSPSYFFPQYVAPQMVQQQQAPYPTSDHNGNRSVLTLGSPRVDDDTFTENHKLNLNDIKSDHISLLDTGNIDIVLQREV